MEEMRVTESEKQDGQQERRDKGQISNSGHSSDCSDRSTEKAYRSGSEDRVAREAIGGTAENLPEGYYHSPNFIGTIAGLALGSISTYLGWVLPSNLISVINVDLGPDENYLWLATSWTLAVAVSSLLWGRLSDIFGRRWFCVGGNVLCLAGAIVGATARSITALIWANALVGLAVPAQLGFTVAVAELVPNRWRGIANGLMFCASMPFAVFGAVIARALAANTAAGWRWCYYLNVMTTAAALLLLLVFYHPPDFRMLHTRASKIDVLRRLDYVGIALFTAGLTLFLLGLNWGGQMYPWTSGETLGTLIGGISLLVAFAFWEKFGAASPLVPMHLLANRGYVGVVLTAAAGSMIYYSLTVLWPIQITVMYTDDPLQVGWLSCAVGGSTLLGQLIGGVLVRPLRRQKLQMAFCAAGMTAMIGSMAATTEKSASLTLCCLGCLFVGYIEICSLTTAPLCLDEGDIGLATGVLGSTRTALAGIALSVYISVLTNRVQTNLPAYVAPAAEAAGLDASAVPALLAALSGLADLGSVPGLTPEALAVVMEAFRRAYAASFRIVYLVSITFGALAIVAALCSPNLESKFGSHISRRMHQTEASSSRDGRTVGGSSAGAGYLAGVVGETRAGDSNTSEV